MGAKTLSLHKAIEYAKQCDYGEVINSIGEKFTLDEFYKREGNSRGWLVIPNIAGKDAKMISILILEDVTGFLLLGQIDKIAIL